MKTSDKKIIKSLFGSFIGIHILVMILGSFLLTAYEPTLTSQVDSIAVASLTAFSGGFNDFHFSNDESQLLGIIFKILGYVAWLHFAPIILIYWKSQADTYPDVSGGYEPKK